MNDDKASSEAQSRGRKNSGAAPCSLLPCPFCGNEDPEIEWGDDDILHRCRKCGTKGPSTWYEDGFLDIHGDVIEPDAEADNQKKWNKRFVKKEGSTDGYPFTQTMRLCPKCGNKRCPHATDDKNQCTNSNKPGQPGSAY